MGGSTGQFCNPSNHQLEAYVVDSDKNVVERCTVCGWQYFHIITDGNDASVKQSFSSDE